MAKQLLCLENTIQQNQKEGISQRETPRITCYHQHVSQWEVEGGFRVMSSIHTKYVQCAFCKKHTPICAILSTFTTYNLNYIHFSSRL